MRSTGAELFSFEGFTLDLVRGRLRNASQEIELRPKSFELLRYMVENADRLISKDELINVLWSNVIVSDDSLAQCVSDLRHALNDPDRRIIRTVPRRGYLFAAQVSVQSRQLALDETFARGSDDSERDFTKRDLALGPALSSRRNHTIATRRLAAILAADVVGYSRLTGIDEEGTHERLKAYLGELVDPKIREHRGRTVKTTGDGLLAEFGSVVDAVRCAVEIQREMLEHERDVPDERRIKFRIGINLGDVIVEEYDIFGDGVNIAARLEALAEPGGICISALVHEQVHGRLEYIFDYIGEQNLKNITRPVRVYRVRPDRQPDAMAGPASSTTTTTAGTRPAPSLKGLVLLTALVAVLVLAVMTLWGVRRDGVRIVEQPSLPHLSIAVLPFDNFGDRPEDTSLANSLSDDITTKLAQIPNAFVVARTTAFSFKGNLLGAPQIGAKLGVRYVVEGSLHRFGDMIRVNAQLIDAASGAHLWAEQFEADTRDAGRRQRHLMGCVCSLKVAVLDAEARRLEREPPGSLTAADLLLQVEASGNHPPTLEQDVLNTKRLERALQLDPRSVEAMIALSTVLLRPLFQGRQVELNWESGPARIRRARHLIEQARSIAPDTRSVLTAQALLLRVRERWDEAEAAYRHLLDRYPNDPLLNNQVAVCDIALGRSERALPLLRKALSLSPDELPRYASEINMGRALVRLGRDSEAVDWLLRAEQEAPVVPAGVHELLAAAYAHLGRASDARTELIAYTAAVPWMTLRWLRHDIRPHSDAVIAERAREIDGLAKAGLRDHAEEQGDSGVDPKLGLRSHDFFNPTPLGAPGVTTITTVALAALLGRHDGPDRPVILVTAGPEPDFRIPGSINLPGIFAGSSFGAEGRHALAEKMEQLMGGSKTHPVVAAGWNAERWSGRNLALQLLALGYQNVYWYRGGLEAWDVAGLPEEPATGAASTAVPFISQ